MMETRQEVVAVMNVFRAGRDWLGGEAIRKDPGRDVASFLRRPCTCSWILVQTGFTPHYIRPPPAVNHSCRFLDRQFHLFVPQQNHPCARGAIVALHPATSLALRFALIIVLGLSAAR
jgi:hypothetical protein